MIGTNINIKTTAINELMNRSIDEISRIVSPIAEKYGIQRVYLFGSRARGDNSEDSDYDFIIESGSVHNIMELFAFMNDLEDALGNKVDVIEERTISEEGFLKSMNRDKVLVYGKSC